ncbi:MAG: hypothetical protein P4L69_07820, partial [Desulfosporosinus sp.]|nr:hypothetical protein [Desulfosporosinus sp.]
SPNSCQGCNQEPYLLPSETPRSRPMIQDGAHGMCRPPTHVKDAIKNRPFSRPVRNLAVTRPKPGTQYDTSATSLRKQTSKLPFKRPTPNAGQRTRMCAAANAPRMALLAGTPSPRAGA